MKTIICGPPHSGKSVFIANLIRYLPYDSYIRINANGDGEGTWSNNSDQTEVQKERKKTGNTPKDFQTWADRIKSVSADIVIIDIGGRLQEDKAPLFDAADSFIILSSDTSVIKDWKEFGEAHKCRCVAIIESYLTGEEELYETTEEWVSGKICGLERGVTLTESSVIKAVVEKLIDISGYKHSSVLDFYEIGQELNCAKTWHTSTGMPVLNIYFPFSIAQPLSERLRMISSPYVRYKILNLRTNWVAVIATYSLCADDIRNISFYDEWTNEYVVPAPLRVCDEIDEDIECRVQETDDAVFLTITPLKGQIDLKRFKDYPLPKINENKPLFLSGRLPSWFTVSVLGSYHSVEQYLLQPGNHYICVKAAETSELGKIVNPK